MIIVMIGKQIPTPVSAILPVSGILPIYILSTTLYKRFRSCANVIGIDSSRIFRYTFPFEKSVWCVFTPNPPPLSQIFRPPYFSFLQPEYRSYNTDHDHTADPEQEKTKINSKNSWNRNFRKQDICLRTVYDGADITQFFCISDFHRTSHSQDKNRNAQRNQWKSLIWTAINGKVFCKVYFTNIRKETHHSNGWILPFWSFINKILILCQKQANCKIK